MRFTQATIIAAAAFFYSAQALPQINDMNKAHQDYVQHCVDTTSNAADGAQCCSQAYSACIDASGRSIATCMPFQDECRKATGNAPQKRGLDMNQAHQDYVQHCIDTTSTPADGAECCSQAYTACIDASGRSIATCMPLKRECRKATGNTPDKRGLDMNQAHQDYVQHCVDTTSTPADGAECCSQAYTSCIDASGRSIATCMPLKRECRKATGNTPDKRQINDMDQAHEDYVQHCVDTTSTPADGAECCSQAYTACIKASGGSVASCMPLQNECRKETGNQPQKL